MFDFFDQLEALDRPMVQKKPWMHKKQMVRVTPEMLPSVIDQCIVSGLYAVDLETSGLDNRVYNNRTRDYIVGCCLSPDGEAGYYIPVRHMNHMDVCVPVSLFESEMRRLFATNSVAIFHNGKFDQEFFQFPGGEPMSEFDDPKKWEDTLILAYLRDTHAKNKGLKYLSKTMLDMEMIELEDLFTKEQLNEHGHNFGVLDPTWEPSVWYGASDAICTYLLYHRLRNEALDAFEGKNGQRFPVGSGGTLVPSQETIYMIEKLDITAVRWMERCRIPIDRNKVEELIRIGQRDWLPSLLDVYTEASKILGRDVTPGYVRLLSDPKSEYYFDTDAVGMSPDVPGSDGVDTTLMGRVDRARIAAERMNLDPTEVVDRKKSKVQTLPKSVPKITDPSHMEIVDFPLVYDILLPEQLGLLLRELGVDGLVATEKSGQIKTSKDELDRVIEQAGERFPFIGKIKRFREVAKALASNLQPIYDDTHPERSPDSTIRVNFEPLKTDTGRFSTPAPKESRGFHGTVRWNLQSIPAAYDTKKPECMLRLREVITAPPDSVICSVDYSGQELRLATNFSAEPKWVNEFFRCSDCEYEFDRGGFTPPPPEPPPTFCPRCGSDKIGDLHSLTALSIFGEGIREEKAIFKAKRQSSKCVHPDTIIIQDGRVVPIRTLPFGSEDTFHPVGGTIQGKEGSIPLLESYNGGTKMLYHVVTTRGIVTCSENHPFMTTNGLKSIQDGLSIGDVVEDCAPVCVGDFPYEPIIIDLHGDVPNLVYTPDHAMSYFAGMYHGDGSKAGDRCITITHGHVSKSDIMGISYKDWQDQIVEATEAAGLRPVRKGKHVYVGSRNTIRFLEMLELHDKDGRRRLRIPSWVLCAGREAILSYLAGLLDTDGMVTHKDGCGKICTKDVIFAGQIAAALASVGIVPRTEPSWNKTYKRYYWVIHITSKGMNDLLPYMRHPGKKARVKPHKQFNAFKENRVKLILPFQDHQCYDVHVGDPSHTFWCNGVLTHNSLNFAMVYGGGGSAAQRAIGCSKDEGWRIKHQFDKTYKTLATWWRKMHEYARATGVVLTAYNRRIYLPDINHPDGGFRSKAERNATNGPIQGCLHGDCRVSTRQGLVKVSELMDRGSDFDIWTGVSWQRARPMFSGMKKHCVTYLNDGLDIHTSPDHLFRVYRGGQEGLCWVRQEDLQIGDSVACDRGLNHDHPEPYLYRHVTAKEDLQEYVPMYDVEVFDEDHAFSCDGVIVHNSGSDIMKLAMGMLYKEYKRRGWLDKVKVIITIHDELVFVIPKNLLAEVIPVTKDIMIRKTIAKMTWRVPLTCDVEAGPDWSVPWNLTKIEFGKEPMPPELAPYLSHIVKVKGEKAEKAEHVDPFVLQIPMEMLSEEALGYLAEVLSQVPKGKVPAFIKITETDEVLWEGMVESAESLKELLGHENS